MKVRVGVIGSGGKIPLNIQKVAEKIGRDIAKNDCVLICGGKEGVMESACKGAMGEGGITIGILPSLDKHKANEYVNVPINTGMGYARNALVVASSDVIIAIGGGSGTLSELALAQNYGKEVVFVSNTSGIEPALKEIERSSKIKIHYASAENAVKIALNLI